jgi:CNT family concentrative nucleoside transporter
MAAIMLPPSALSDTAARALPSPYDGSVDAVVSGVGEGLRLLGNIVAMLIAFVALVSLVNQLLGLLPHESEPYTLTGLLGFLLAPLAWLLGVPWAETELAGELLATKVVINELVAYLRLGAIPADDLGLQSRIILTYALCGFANFGSLGIMLGGMTALCPERRQDILRLAPRSVWSGFLATCLTGAIAGLVY